VLSDNPCEATVFDEGRRTFDSEIARWASVGPYYAMFPVGFAFEVVRSLSRPGDAVLDPFAGRGSSVYAAAALGRGAVGIEINPVGWLYGSVKLRPASMSRVLERLREIEAATALSGTANEIAANLPPFFRAAYAPGVLRFLLTARRRLDWRKSRVDGTLMAFILVYLHGKREASLSNQLRDGKAMAPDYAVRWWKERKMRPPSLDPAAFLSQRIEWRYKRGAPAFDATVRLGDSVKVVRDLASRVARGAQRPFDLLFTSPPYMGITNYHYDQWLRLWMLGGDPTAARTGGGRWQRKFESREQYVELLTGVFGGAVPAMSPKATVYVRTDAREFTLSATIDALQEAFPKKWLRTIDRPLTRRSQTALFGDKGEKPGEVDIIMTK
jgi:hypothetical protein